MTTIPTSEQRRAVEDAAFAAWQNVSHADFYLMMAHKHGNPETAACARSYLLMAVAVLDAVAVDGVTFGGAPV